MDSHPRAPCQDVWRASSRWRCYEEGSETVGEWLFFLEYLGGGLDCQSSNKFLQVEGRGRWVEQGPSSGIGFCPNKALDQALLMDQQDD